MIVFHTDRHRGHAPALEFQGDRMGPYPEVPDRVDVIRHALAGPNHALSEVAELADPDALAVVHDADYLAFLRDVWPEWARRTESERDLTPYTFAVGDLAYRPRDLVHQVGWYGFDPQTPIVAGTWEAASSSAQCAISAAECLLDGESRAYALCRPPGHHAGHASYGGYCFLNNAALAAERLGGPTAILDIDYHHGNGTQSIFYDTDRVLFVSIHADPDRQYPFFSGSVSETGVGPGEGATANFPLGPGIEDAAYLETLDRALNVIGAFDPGTLVVSAGLDICDRDPLGDFHVTENGLERIGQRIATLEKPVAVVQEGGYNTSDLGQSVVALLSGLET